ncbi:MAG: dihydrofolate reductase [Pseudomonadota bacterium]
MEIALIYARARNGTIGKDGTMPWRLPPDMRRFKALTMGHPVVMGRKTWDSLPPRFRPLEGRRNIVVTRQPGWHAEGAERAGSLSEALALCDGAPLVWIAGGAEIYAQAMPLAHTAQVTEIDADFDGDAFAPTLGPGWQETARERHPADNGLAYSFVTYHNTQQAQNGA